MKKEKQNILKVNLTLYFSMIIGLNLFFNSCQQVTTEENNFTEEIKENYEVGDSRIYMSSYYYNAFVLDSIVNKNEPPLKNPIIALSSIINPKDFPDASFSKNFNKVFQGYEGPFYGSTLNEMYIYKFDDRQPWNEVNEVLFCWKKNGLQFYKTKDDVLSIEFVEDSLNQNTVKINGIKYFDVTALLKPKKTNIIGGDEIYNLVTKYVKNNFNSNFEAIFNSLVKSDLNHKKSNKTEPYFIKYENPSFLLSEYSTEEMLYAQVKFFSKRKDRSLLKTKELKNVYGINQFLMDHDLTTGFVHPYTNNFFKKLDSWGFVLKVERSQKRLNEGRIYYIHKVQLTKDDILGENICFARQWRLSEISLDGDQIFLKQCNYAKSCKCLQTKNTAATYFKPEIPLYTQSGKDGLQNVNDLDKIGLKEGGGVDIIWQNKEGEIMFINMFTSIKKIIAKAYEIKAKYNCDPTIAVYDAGTYARRFQAKNSVIQFDEINQKLGNGEFLGAGFGFTKN